MLHIGKTPSSLLLKSILDERCAVLQGNDLFLSSCETATDVTLSLTVEQ